MRHITAINKMQLFSRQARAGGKSLGLVPTMGALHEGHVSLIRHAKHQCDVVVVSIFVNPTQFGEGDDFSNYPRRLQKDLELLKAYNVDAAFVPSAAEMYPEGFGTCLEPGALGEPLEGRFRPGHFRGVTTVVLKLFNIVRPDVAYFGQKDFQQAMLIRRLVEDLNLEIRLVICPIVREEDGLAISSRNVYLSLEDRQAALALNRSLCRASQMAQEGETEAQKLLEEMRKVLASEPRVQPDYVAIVEPARLQPVERVTPGCVALVAARVGPARLIDNLIFGPPGASPDTLLLSALAARPLADIHARIPGLETETLRQRIEACRECAALASIRLPPREFLTKYLKRDYPDLNVVRVMVVARDAPIHPENFLYRGPERTNRFVAELFDLLGVKDFAAFKARFVLTDAIRCHASGPRVPERALVYCAKHLQDEMKLFPNLETIIVLGDDAYWQFQHMVLGRNAAGIKPLRDLLKAQGWAQEDVRLPPLGDRALRVIYCYHPTYGYNHSPSIAPMLA